MVEIGGVGANGQGLGNISINTDKPLKCPYCHVSIETQAILYVHFNADNKQVLLKCKSCQNAFVANLVKHPSSGFFFIGEMSKGFKHKTSVFEDEITTISPLFVQIFQEAEIAEQEKLMQICGIGYRKALEFLIKDYLIKKKPNEKTQIEAMLLGDCIKTKIEDGKIKAIAERAVWLGNDETHYTRKWEGKDLSDLKRLITITVHFISMDIHASKYIEEMKK